MVQFSEILGKKPTKREEAPPRRNEAQPEKFRMSNLQFAEKEALQPASELPSKDRDTGKIKRFYDVLLQKAVGIRDSVKKDQAITASPVLSILHQIIEADLIDELYAYAIPIAEDEGLPSHTISVTLAALKVAKGMGYDSNKLLKLALMAFFENVGMYKVDDRILQKKGQLSGDEFSQIRKHPEVSAQIIGTMGGTFQPLAKIALQVHERSDGSGYPNGLKGKEISEIALIIGMVDTYMAMIKNRPHRGKHMQPHAVKSILALGKGKFPPRIVKEFLNQVSFFPVNTYVKLNNKSIGRVVSTNKAQPLRPGIELVFDGLGNRLEKEKLIQLSESPLLHIVDTIDEKDLPD